MKNRPACFSVRRCILLGILTVLVLGACSPGAEGANKTISPPTESLVTESLPSETPAPAEITPPTITPTEALPEPTPTQVPSPTPTRLPEDPWGRMTYNLPELAGAIKATNLGVEALAQWGKGHTKSMAFSPDGSLVGIETFVGQYIYNAHSMAPIPYDENLWKEIYPNGSMYVTYRGMNWLLFKDSELILQVLSESPYASALSPGQGFAAGFDEAEGIATLYNTEDGQTTDTINLEELEMCLEENPLGKLMPTVKSLAVMESGQSLAVSCLSTDELTLFNVDGKKILTFDLEAAGLTNSLYELQFSPDGSYLAGISYDANDVNTVFVWNTDDGSLVLALGRKDIDIYPITDISFSPDNGKLLISRGNGQVQLWNLSNQDDAYLLHPETLSGEDVDFSPDGSKLLAPFSEHFVILETSTGQVLQDVVLDEAFKEYGGCNEFVFRADGSQLACLASRLLVWQADDITEPLNAGQAGSELKEVPGLEAMALIRESLQVLNPADWKPMDTILLSDKSSSTYDFSPDGKLLALGEYGSVQILSRKEGKKFKGVEELEVENSDLLRFSPDGSRLAVIDMHGLRLFDTKTWEEVGFWEDEFPMIFGDTIFDSIEPGLYELAFSPDGSLLATGSGDDIHLRSAESGKLLISLPGHTSLVSALAFSPDGKLLASASWDGTVRLWGIPK